MINFADIPDDLCEAFSSLIFCLLLWHSPNNAKKYLKKIWKYVVTNFRRDRETAAFSKD